MSIQAWPAPDFTLGGTYSKAGPAVVIPSSVDISISAWAWTLRRYIEPIAALSVCGLPLNAWSSNRKIAQPAKLELLKTVVVLLAVGMNVVVVAGPHLDMCGALALFHDLVERGKR
jgi:hypothetical protein